MAAGFSRCRRRSECSTAPSPVTRRTDPGSTPRQGRWSVRPRRLGPFQVPEHHHRGQFGNGGKICCGHGGTCAIPSGGDCEGTLTSDGNNLMGSTDCTVIGAPPLSLDPKLGPLQDNGGPTRHTRPAAGQSGHRCGRSRWLPRRSRHSADDRSARLCASVRQRVRHRRVRIRMPARTRSTPRASSSRTPGLPACCRSSPTTAGAPGPRPAT